MENEVMYIKLDDIIPNRFQPREVFEEDALNKLADSIRQHGVIEPIIVRPVSNKFEIIAGERRYKASVLAGLTKIPALVKQMDDKESSIVAYIENEHRSNVSAIEEARTINRILKGNDMTQEELAKEIGINQSTLANKLRLLSLPMEIQEALLHNEISERHARSLLSVKDEAQQLELLKKIKEKRMTVRELDSEIKNMNNYGNMENNEPNNIYEGMNRTQPLNSNQEYMSNLNSNDSIPASNEPDFMSFLNNFDNNPAANNIMPSQDNMPMNNYENNIYEGINNNPQQEVNQDYPSNLNNFDSIPANNELANEVENNNQPVDEDPGFMSFLNNYDNTVESNNNLTPQDDVLMNDFENNESDNIYAGMNNESLGVNQDNMNNFDTPVDNIESPQEAGFMDFLNNYDTNNPLPEDASSNILEEPIQNDYLNNNFTEVNNNVVINDVTPPVTSNFDSNSYVENNPNYVDVSKNVVIDNVDEIIDRLKVVIDDIKSASKFKIDTDEIDFDDIYQITIKVDKRDF